MSPGSGQRLADEAVAFLSGRYVEWVVEQGAPVPAWAWMNVIAHGSEEDLIRASSRNRCVEPESLVADLSTRLLDLLTRSDVDLRELQLSTLIPLESRMREMFHSRSPRDSSQLAQWFAKAAGQQLSGLPWMTS